MSTYSPKFRRFFIAFLWALLQDVMPVAHAADTIVVGRSLALSGPLKSYGEAKRDGGDAHISKVNAAGGVGGKKIELVTLDDVYTPATTVENLKKSALSATPPHFWDCSVCRPLLLPYLCCWN